MGDYAKAEPLYERAPDLGSPDFLLTLGSIPDSLDCSNFDFYMIPDSCPREGVAP